MKYLTLMVFVILTSCGPTREQKADAKAAEIIQSLQGLGQMRMLSPQEYYVTRSWIASKLLEGVE